MSAKAGAAKPKAASSTTACEPFPLSAVRFEAVRDQWTPVYEVRLFKTGDSYV